MFATIITLPIYSFTMIIKLVPHQLQLLLQGFPKLFQRSILDSHLFLFILLAHLLDHLLFLPKFLQLPPMVVLAKLVTLHFLPVKVMLVFLFVIKLAIPSAQFPIMPEGLELSALIVAVVFRRCQAHLAAYLTIPRSVSY